MAVRLFNLNGVPEDEAEEVCALLEQAGMEFYITPPGRWGISVHALWLCDDTRLVEARHLLAGYQVARQQRVRAAYAVARQAGTAPTLWDSIKRQPLRVVVLVGLTLLVLYLSVKPFLDLWRP